MDRDDSSPCCLHAPEYQLFRLLYRSGLANSIMILPCPLVLDVCPAEVKVGGNPDSNTLISDMTTVICLDDFHSLDRSGRTREKVTALDPKAQNFKLMYEQ
eukprot:scaffold113981_cov20-Tisochrysis_lutea.AAC.3